MLRVLMQMSVFWRCEDDLDQRTAVRSLVTDAKTAMKDEDTARKRKNVTKCLWDSIKEWEVIPFFCPNYKFEKYMEVYDKGLALLHQFLCTGNDKSTKLKLICTMVEMVLENFPAIRKMVKPYLCEDDGEEHDGVSRQTVQKRQYDPDTLTDAIRRGLCLQIGNDHFNAALIDGGENPFLYNFFCCMFQFLPK